MKTTSVLMDEALWNYAQRVAVELGSTRSRILRDALYTVLEKHANGGRVRLSCSPYRPSGRTGWQLPANHRFQTIDGMTRVVEIDMDTGLALREVYERPPPLKITPWSEIGKGMPQGDAHDPSGGAVSRAGGAGGDGANGDGVANGDGDDDQF